MSTNNYRFTDLKDALSRLKEVLIIEEKTDIIRDSAIKRFELCADLAWKCAQDFAKSKNIECRSPNDCFRTAFQLGLVEHDGRWISMMKDHNRTAHIYRESLAEEIYTKLAEYVQMLEGFIQKLEPYYS